MNKEYVQQYALLEKTHWWFLVRKKIISHFLKKHLPVHSSQQISILNVGAAAGASGELLSGFGKVVSVETEPYFINYLKEKNIGVTEASVTSLPFADNSFDLVCAFDVIEHVKDDLAAVKEMTRVCKPGGSICITVPAGKILWSNHDIVNAHYRRYTKPALKNLFAEQPLLTQTDSRYFNSLLFVPVLLLRKTSGLFRSKKSKSKSDFEFFKTPLFIDHLLQQVFRIELVLGKFIRFPFGVSLISFFKKENKL